MAERLEHLRISRLVRENPRRTTPRRPKQTLPADLIAHATKLRADFARIAEAVPLPGFDQRLLLELSGPSLMPDVLSSIPGLDLVSEEAPGVVLAFADEIARIEFEDRINDLARTGVGTGPNRVLLALSGADQRRPESRLGPTLRHQAWPPTGPIALDVELYPLERSDHRTALVEAFLSYCREQGIEVLDKVVRPTIIVVRVKCSEANAPALLKYRDVRFVDLLPDTSLPKSARTTAVTDLSPVSPPPDGCPGVVILDTGFATNHPLLSPAVGDAQSFWPGLPSEDDNGHGTFVGGLALYGDLAPLLKNRTFVPEVRLFSGRVLGREREAGPLFESQVTKAVEYFTENYGCKVFNVSVGNALRPYEGQHVGPWATLLDDLAHKHGVVFVVSAGNFLGTDSTPSDWIGEYPGYLLSADSRVIDPAPALNVVTVGSLARYERGVEAERFPNDPAYQPIAREDEPSPFTRSGPSVKGAVKPDLVDYGGNWLVDHRVGGHQPHGSQQLGELSLSLDFAAGKLFSVDSGTSFSAPKVAWLAASFLRVNPAASANLVRAMLVASAQVPAATERRIPKGHAKDRGPSPTARLVGYGRPTYELMMGSTERRVCLYAEEVLPQDSTHFFELPLVDAFLTGRRPRRITVALSHMPVVRRTRLGYRGSEFSFRLVRDVNEDSVFETFKWTKKDEQERLANEDGKLRPGTTIRGKGTVQVASWSLKQFGPAWAREKAFIVVTRRVPPWAQGLVDDEPYALVVVLEEQTEVEIKLHTQIKAHLQVRARARVRG